MLLIRVHNPKYAMIQNSPYLLTMGINISAEIKTYHQVTNVVHVLTQTKKNKLMMKEKQLKKIIRELINDHGHPVNSPILIQVKLCVLWLHQCLIRMRTKM